MIQHIVYHHLFPASRKNGFSKKESRKSPGSATTLHFLRNPWMWGSQERSYFNEYWSGPMKTVLESDTERLILESLYIVTLKSGWIIFNNVDIYVHLHLKCWFISGFRRFCNRSTFWLDLLPTSCHHVKVALNSKLCQPGGPTSPFHPFFS